MKTYIFSGLILSFVFLFSCKKAATNETEKPKSIVTNPTVKQDSSSKAHKGTSIAEISPISENLNPSFKTWEISPNKDNLLTFASGTHIHIPKNAFALPSGKKANQKITIRYREFHDAAAILCAGIPMEIQTNKGVEHLQTAGMYEIRAESEGQKLELVDNKTISVSLVSHKTGNDYDMYYFEEGTSGWNKIGKPKTFSTVNITPLKEEKEKIEDEQLSVPLGNAYFAFNYNAFLDISFPGNLAQGWEFIRKMAFNNDEDNPFINEKTKKYGLKWHKAICNSPVQFEGNQYPAGMMLWKYHEGVRIPDWLDDSYNIEIHPIKNGEANVYHLIVDDKERYFDAYIELVMPLKGLFAFEPAYWNEHKAEALAKISAEEERMKSEAQLIRSFSINKMGLYNCDRILSTQGAIYVKADFVFPEGKESLYKNDKIYFIPEDNSSVITYYRQKDLKVAISPSLNCRILSISSDGNLAYFSINQYKKIPFAQLKSAKDPEYVFHLEATNRKARAEVDIREILGM